MHQLFRRARSPFGAVVAVALVACNPEAITTPAPDQSAAPAASVGRPDTGTTAREKWLLRLADQEAAVAGPNRWFSLQPGTVQAIGASRALLTAPQGAAAMLSEGDESPPGVLTGATSVSLAASNIYVLTMYTERVYELSGDGDYNVYINDKALGGSSYRTWAYNAALYSQSVSISVNSSATDTIEVGARTSHRVRHREAATMADAFYDGVVSFGYERFAPAQPAPPPINYEGYGSGPDSPPEGEVQCWFHYRSYDGGHTWYLLRVSCPDMAGKYRGLVPSSALHSTSPDGAVRSASATSGQAQTASPSTFVVLGQDRLQDGERAVVYLRPGMSPEAVIAIDRKNARPSDIAEGIAAMMKARADASPGDEGAFYRTTVMRSTKIAPAPSASAQARFGGYLAAMKRAPLIDVPGVGRGYAVEVRMPTGH